MPAFKPRSKRAYHKALRGLRVSREVKAILAEIANEIEGAYCDALSELRTSALATLYAVDAEFGRRRVVQKRVKSLIKKLKGVTK